MTRAQLRLSHVLWRARERYRYRKWRAYSRLLPEGHRLREKWYRLYIEAKEKRRHRSRQIRDKHRRVVGVSRRGVELVKEFEGFSSRPYRDPVGVWTIGYGRTRGVGPRSKPISEKEASALLLSDLESTYFPHVRALPTFKRLNQHQVDALTSFVYNLGPGAIGRRTGIGRALRKRRWKRAAKEMLRWNRAGGRVLPGLTRRRRAEQALFLR